MKWYRGRDGNERLWLERDEIESMMEDELRKAKLFPPQEDPPVVDIERFIERHLGVRLDQHADLESAVLGLTEFYADSPPKIFIHSSRYFNRGCSINIVFRCVTCRGRYQLLVDHPWSLVLPWGEIPKISRPALLGCLS